MYIRQEDTIANGDDPLRLLVECPDVVYLHGRGRGNVGCDLHNVDIGGSIERVRIAGHDIHGAREHAIDIARRQGLRNVGRRAVNGVVHPEVRRGRVVVDEVARIGFPESTRLARVGDFPVGHAGAILCDHRRKGAGRDLVQLPLDRQDPGELHTATEDDVVRRVRGLVGEKGDGRGLVKNRAPGVPATDNLCIRFQGRGGGQPRVCIIAGDRVDEPYRLVEIGVVRGAGAVRRQGRDGRRRGRGRDGRGWRRRRRGWRP